MIARRKATTQILKKRARREKWRFVSWMVRWSVRAILFLMISGVLAMVGVYFYLSDDLPKISSLKDYRPPVITTVYSDDNRKIAEFYKNGES